MTKTLILTVGLPRSGKSTWSRQQGCPIVNPDSIRLALHERYQWLAEPFVWAIAKVMVRSLFLAGHDKVIVDATHVKREYREQWRKESCDWNVVCKLIPTSKEECLARADDEIIIPIIERMASDFEPLEADEYLLESPKNPVIGYNLETGE